MPTLLFILGLGAALASLVTVVRVRHPAPLAFPIMMTGWLTGEYPIFHAVLQVIVTIVLIALGGLGSALGIAGLGLMAASLVGLAVAHRSTHRARPEGEAALQEAFGENYLDGVDDERRRRLRTAPEPGLTRHPLRFDRAGISIQRDLAYGEHPKRHLLDVYGPAEPPGTPAPVVVQIHGGAWIIGHKMQQGQPLLHQLARNGYIGVAINYRLGPKHRFPDHIIDVKRAIAWVRANIADHGGDPDTIVLTGGSAGGHLAALAALTPNHTAWQPGFEDVDTAVAGCVPFYGPPDLRDRDRIRGRLASMEPFLARMVMPGRERQYPELWEQVSPISHVGSHAPPFFVIQGANDVLVWREEARAFVDALRSASNQPVGYWQVHGAQHAFDVLNSVRSAAAVDVVERFVASVSAATLAPTSDQAVE